MTPLTPEERARFASWLEEWSAEHEDPTDTSYTPSILETLRAGAEVMLPTFPALVHRIVNMDARISSLMRDRDAYGELAHQAIAKATRLQTAMDAHRDGLAPLTKRAEDLYSYVNAAVRKLADWERRLGVVEAEHAALRGSGTTHMEVAFARLMAGWKRDGIPDPTK